jgi:hypothetical protein
VTRRVVQFEIGELVWVYLPKERFPRDEYHKLKQRKVGSCEILEKFGANAYRVMFPHILFSYQLLIILSLDLFFFFFFFFSVFAFIFLIDYSSPHPH